MIIICTKQNGIFKKYIHLKCFFHSVELIPH